MLGSGVTLASLAAPAQAAVGVYYIESYVDSQWVDVTASVSTSHHGPAFSNMYGSLDTPSFLAGTFTFDEASSSEASPQSVVGTGGYATANSFLDATISSTGFVIYGGGTADAQLGSDATASSITADLLAYMSFNFRVPADSVPVELFLNGYALATSRSTLTFRIAEITPDLQNTTNIVYINRTTSNTLNFNQTWENDSYMLNPGGYYVVDLYALPGATVTQSAMGPLLRTSEINITGTFVPIPEPGAIGILIGASCLLFRRRRECIAK